MGTVAIALLALAVSMAFTSSAGAAAPDFVLRVPVEGKPGGGAGELDNPRGMTVNPSTGHLYVADRRNARISEFTAWGSFVKAWGWGVADGTAELQTCGPTEPEATPPLGLCREGLQGEGPGQMALLAGGIEIDAAGNVWVGDLENNRIQKFSPAGEFLLMLGGEVNKTTKADVCTQEDVDGGDECGKGTVGEGPSQLTSTLNDIIAYSSTADAIVVGGKDRIQEFNLGGTFKTQIPFEGELAPFEGKSVTGLDVDLAGNIYITLSGLEDVYKLSGAGQPLEPGKPNASKFEVGNPQAAVAVDDSGNVYVTDDPPGEFSNQQTRVLEFNLAGNKLVPTKEEEEEERFFPYIPFQGPPLIALTTNICVGSEAPGSLYVAAYRGGQWAYFEGYGSGPTGCEDPPIVEPTITAQYAASVKTQSATLRAQINPHFWQDTTYFVQYGTGKCSEGGCDKELPAPPALLTSKAIQKAVTSGGVFLGGLEPGTTYHYRFVTESSGGGPVIGEEHSFTTFPPATPIPACANDEFRSGPGAKLPDCRAYELVSPLDKANGDAGLLPSTLVFHELNLSSTSGERFTYSSVTPFAGPESAPFISQYLASRDPKAGWSSESLMPPRSARVQEGFLSLNNEFKAFSADLCMAWLRHNSVSTLAPEAIPDFANLYRRDNCGAAPNYEALTTTKPPTRPAQRYRVNVVGFSEDGSQTIFLADDALTDDAPVLPEEPKQLQLYEHGPEGLRFVCHLPNGDPTPAACAAGIAAGQPDGKASSVQGAISSDGSRVFWTAYKGNLGAAPEGIPGQIYMRQNPDREPTASGECSETEPENACTIAVSEAATPGDEEAIYWGAAKDGSKAIFEVVEGPLNNNLYEFDVASETAKPIAEGVLGPMGMSEDASRVYFASSKDLAAGGSEGGRNLYLYDADEESFSFIMALAPTDIGGSELQPKAITEVPNKRSATVSADGLHAAFSSAASPTPGGYDNLDAVSGLADEEAYLYDAAAGKLRCVSCNPTGARPAGEDIGGVWAAARLPNSRASLEPPHPLAEDGKRLFFDSHEALVARDTNGTWDVYQWEAPGAGDCDKGDSSFGEAAEGCVDLISSGESAAESRFLDADPSGKNVFIGTQSSLIASDFGSNDVYDARIGGGFPIPSPRPSCEGEACQSPPAPPAEVTPASAATEGAGNVVKPKGCKRGTRKVQRKGKTRCVRKAKHKKASKRGNKGRRAAR